MVQSTKSRHKSTKLMCPYLTVLLSLSKDNFEEMSTQIWRDWPKPPRLSGDIPNKAKG